MVVEPGYLWRAALISAGEWRQATDARSRADERVSVADGLASVRVLMTEGLD